MRRIFIIVIILAVLLTLGALLLLWIGAEDAVENNENTNTLNNNSPAIVNSVINTSGNSNSASPVTPQSTLIGQGRSFAERFASWSREEFDIYLTGLRPWLSAAYASTIQTENEGIDSPKSVVSVTSRVLTSSLRTWNPESDASIEFVMDRTEQRSDVGSVHYYETLVLEYVFVDGDWKVDATEWQPSRVQPE